MQIFISRGFFSYMLQSEESAVQFYFHIRGYHEPFYSVAADSKSSEFPLRIMDYYRYSRTAGVKTNDTCVYVNSVHGLLPRCFSLSFFHLIRECTHTREVVTCNNGAALASADAMWQFRFPFCALIREQALFQTHSMTRPRAFVHLHNSKQQRFRTGALLSQQVVDLFHLPLKI